MSRACFVLGLGNPGTEYADTRHNVGFWFLDHVALKAGWSWKRPLFATHRMIEAPLRELFALVPDLGLVAEGGDRLVLVEPLTYMNRSGDVMPGLVDRWASKGHEVPPPVVAVDQMDLEPGLFRLKQRGGTAGHNGLKSIHGVLGEAFLPLYIGVGRPAEGVSVIDHVLGLVPEHDAQAIRSGFDRALAGLALHLGGATERALELVNQKARVPSSGD